MPELTLRSMVKDVFASMSYDEQHAFEIYQEAVEYFCKEVLDGWEYYSVQEIAEDCDVPDSLAAILFQHCKIGY